MILFQIQNFLTLIQTTFTSLIARKASRRIGSTMSRSSQSNKTLHASASLGSALSGHGSSTSSMLTAGGAASSQNLLLAPPQHHLYVPSLSLSYTHTQHSLPMKCRMNVVFWQKLWRIGMRKNEERYKFKTWKTFQKLKPIFISFNISDLSNKSGSFHRLCKISVKFSYFFLTQLCSFMSFDFSSHCPKSCHWLHWSRPQRHTSCNNH